MPEPSMRALQQRAAGVLAELLARPHLPTAAWTITAVGDLVGDTPTPTEVDAWARELNADTHTGGGWHSTRQAKLRNIRVRVRTWQEGKT